MVFDDFKPGCMYGGTQLCGLAMPHMSMSSSSMHLETTDLQKSIEEMHGRLEPDHDTYQIPYQCSTTSGSGKRSGDEDFLSQEKRQRVMQLNNFDDSFPITVDGQGLEGGGNDFSRNEIFCSGMQDHQTMAADCSTSGLVDLDEPSSFMLRDFPHSRHVCVVFPFIPPPCLSNSSHCNKCWCYSCEEVAPCPLWGTGLTSTDHCNATASSWFWLKHKVMGGRAVDHQGLMDSIGGRPSSMSGFSSEQGSIYGPSSFSSLPLGGSLDHSEMSNTLTSLHEESAETDCFASCSPTSSIVLIPSRPRSDPSTDSQQPVCFSISLQSKPTELNHLARHNIDEICNKAKHIAKRHFYLLGFAASVIVDLDPSIDSQYVFESCAEKSAQLNHLISQNIDESGINAKHIDTILSAWLSCLCHRSSGCFEFGTVHIPVKTRQLDRSLEDLVRSFDKYSLELFSRTIGDQGQPAQLQHLEVIARDDESLPTYHALLDEILVNEAQGQLQVIVAVTPDYDFAQVGTAHVRTFLRKDRGDDILVLRELLKELFPDDLALHSHMQSVDELRRWTESSDDWRTFAGLLRDLEGNCYEEAAQPPGLSVPLRPYQRQSLQFMLDSEKREGGLLSINYQPLQTNLTGLPLLYSASLNHLMPAIPDMSGPTVRGGFLCEEMGLGKTIEILALILANPCPAERSAPASSKGTLVVCPVSIVGQWANEVKSKLAANLSIYMYHGSKRIRDPKRLAKFDIVITTYATLGSDFSKATQATRHGSGFAEQFCPLLTVNWWRVVLDESHTVKDPAPLHSRACAQLKADRRWCCTGTPINTSIYDLYGQFLFLKLEPFDNKSIFRRRIGRPYERQCKSDDQTVLLWTLNKMMIRHTKQQKFNGRELLRLPPKTEQDLPVTFTAHERRAYEAVYQHVIHKFEQFRCWGPTVVSKNILQIMSLLLPLRRLCSGGFVSQIELTMSKGAVHDSTGAGALTDALPGAPPLSPTLAGPLDDTDGECGICFELMECPTKTPCGHWFCSECVMSSLPTGSQGQCAICGSPVTASQLYTFTPKQTRAAVALAPLLGTPSNTSPTTSANSEESGEVVRGVQMKSKLKALLADLAKVRKDHDGAKVLIFSQFMQTIAWLKAEFKKQGINYRFISGDMPMKKRAQAIEAFQKDPPTTVFLLSIRTGAVGITLTAASHVYMLEPCLNPALEEQAVGRCWRMGQVRPVVIKRLYVENSVEANILKLLRSRMSAANMSGSQDADSTNRSVKSGKNGAGDVAGCIRTDKQNLRLNEFEILFS